MKNITVAQLKKAAKDLGIDLDFSKVYEYDVEDYWHKLDQLASEITGNIGFSFVASGSDYWAH